jgi:hypothetical protein
MQKKRPIQTTKEHQVKLRKRTGNRSTIHIHLPHPHQFQPPPVSKTLEKNTPKKEEKKPLFAHFSSSKERKTGKRR